MTVALEYCLQPGRVLPPAWFLFLGIALAILGLLWFHMNFWIVCSSSVKNVMDHLIVIALNLQIILGCTAIFTILIFPTQEHGISFHFFASSLISLMNVSQFSAYQSFTSLVRCIPRYLIFWGEILKGIQYCCITFLIFRCWYTEM